MKSLYVIFFAFVISLICGCQTDEHFAADLTVAEISDRMEKATDPNDYYRKSKSYILKQEMKTEQNGEKLTLTVEVKFKLPNFLKTTTYKDGKPLSTVLFDGEKAWEIKGDTGESEAITGKRLELVKTFAAIGHPANTLLTVFPKIDASEIKVGPREYYKLVCHPKYKDIAPYTMYVGKTNFLTKRLETTMYVKGGSLDYTSIIDRYSMYKGVMIASESTVIYNNKLKQVFHVIDYQLNADIPDSEFKLPTPWYLKNTEKRLKQEEKELKKEKKLKDDKKK
jgi:outer membrane lipoprotein-sorting protein